LPPAIFDGSPLWLGVSVNGETEFPREEILAAPFAFRSLEADHAADADSAQHAVEADHAVDADEALHALSADVAIADDGDWTTGGGNVYRSSGNVGIGLSNPSASLQIRREGGTGLLMNSSSGGAVPMLHLRNASTGTDWVLRHDEMNLHFQTEAVAGNEVMTLRSNRRVGIGTTLPVHSLDVVGDANISTNLDVQGNLTVQGTTTLAQPAWQAATLVSPWYNLLDSASGHDDPPVSFYRDSVGIVHLRGTAAGSCSGNQLVFTLPSGYRPEYQLLFVVPSESFAGGEPFARAVRVFPDGRVEVTCTSGSEWVHFQAIDFRAAN
jgi:hypothetical protein